MSAFYGFITEAGRLTLDHRPAFDAYVRTLVGEEVEIEIRKKRTKRSSRQNAGYHAMLMPWARDEGHEIDDLKADLMGTIFGWSEQPSPLSGNKVPLIPHTSSLSVAQFSELIERTMEIAAGCGYVLIAPDEYTARKKAESKRRAT